MDQRRESRVAVLSTRATPQDVADFEEGLRRGGTLSRRWLAVTEPPLHVREAVVLSLLLGGATANEIARKMNLNRRAVDAHCVNAVKKTGIYRRSELTEWALAHGFDVKGRVNTDHPAPDRNQVEVVGPEA